MVFLLVLDELKLLAAEDYECVALKAFVGYLKLVRAFQRRYMLEVPGCNAAPPSSLSVRFPSLDVAHTQCVLQPGGSQQGRSPLPLRLCPSDFPSPLSMLLTPSSSVLFPLPSLDVAHPRCVLQPAGSHGVWSLDDYQFLPFLFGSAQLCEQNAVKPRQILSPPLVKELKVMLAG